MGEMSLSFLIIYYALCIMSISTVSKTRASCNRRLTKFQPPANAAKASHPMIFDVGDVPHVVR